MDLRIQQIIFQSRPDQFDYSNQNKIDAFQNKNITFSVFLPLKQEQIAYQNDDEMLVKQLFQA